MAAEIAKSDFATLYAAQGATARVGGPSKDNYDGRLCFRKQALTVPAGAGAADWWDLGPVLDQGMIVVPHMSGIWYPTSSTGTFTSTLTLSKVSTAGTVVDLTGLATANGAVFDAFLDFASPTTWPVCDAADYLRLYITTLNTATAGRTFNLLIAYMTSFR